jgi:hypothetical protein
VKITTLLHLGLVSCPRMRADLPLHPYSFICGHRGNVTVLVDLHIGKARKSISYTMDKDMNENSMEL